MIRAAGIIFFTKDDEVLLLLRSSKGDHAKEWCFPGGKLEEGETPEQAAIRETREEVGQCPDGERFEFLTTKQVELPPPTPNAPAEPPPLVPELPNEIEFTTFIQFVDEPFEVELDDEHLTSMWCNADDLPLGMHPGAAIAIRRLRGNELDIARMMQAREIEGPQRFGGMWLFDMRITGTGLSYREDLDEHVYRPPELYLNQDFLDRCSGLPVIVEHPEGKMDSEEYRERNVGSVYFAYIHDDEVWAITRILDDVAARLMLDGKLSTSPAVYFRDNTNTTLTNEGGGTVLIEGKPSVLEHLAICPLGVWDKGGPPSGLMRKKDMDANTEKKLFGALDSIVKRLDGIDARHDAAEKRMDSIEAKEGDNKDGDDAVTDPDKSGTSKDRKDKARKDADENDDKEEERKDAAGDDPEDKRDDKARKDSEDGKDEKDKKESEAKEKEAAADRKEEAERKDAAARKDAQRRREDETRHVKHEQRFSDIERLLTGSGAREFAAAQARADQAYTMRQDSAPPPMMGETLNAYRRRLLKPLQRYSKTWEEVDLANISDEPSFKIVEDQIYKDSVSQALSPHSVNEGELREITHVDAVGRKISKFVGQPRAWMSQFMSEPALVTGINKTPNA